LILGQGGANTPANPAAPGHYWAPQALALYNDRTDDRRKDARVAIQWHPSDAVMVTLDDNYSDDHILTYRSEYSTWFNQGELYNVHADGNGTITNFQFGPAPTDFDADFDGSYIKNNTVGINIKWDVNDHLTATFDADQSSSHLNPSGEISNFDVDIGYGPSYNVNQPTFAVGQAAGFPNSYTGGLVVPGGTNNLPFPSGFGPNNNVANVGGLNPLILGSHVLPIQQQINTDIINQAKVDVLWHTDNTKVDLGLQFTEDTRTGYDNDSFTNNAWQLWSGYGSPSLNTNGQALPASLFKDAGVINTSNFFPGFNNSGQLPGILEFNPYTVYNYLTSLGAAGANPNAVAPVPPNCTAGALGCFAPYTGGAEPLGLNPNSINEIQEKTYAPFVTLQQKLNLGTMPLLVNFGVRYDRTDVLTSGIGRLPTTLTVQAADHTAFLIDYTPTQLQTTTNHYAYVLPSLDLNLNVTDELKVRFDASRTETKPPLNEITPTLNVGGRVGALTATGNNPGLLPYLSDNFDLGAEWYYGRNEYLAVDAFYKHVTQFPEQLTVQKAINNVQDPTTGTTAVWSDTTFVNAPIANVDGIEVGFQKMLPFDFGFQINGTLVHTGQNFNRYNTATQFYIPGVANSANFVGFYQAHGFEARLAVNWTASQLQSGGQEQEGGAYGFEPVYTTPFTEVDFSTTYDITDNVSVFLKALNLTAAEIVEHGRFNNQTLNVQDIGRTFTIGVRAKL
jgi:TonB-dependent receptor